MRAADGSGLRKRQRGFAAIPNETVFDGGLSARALGVLVKVVALPEGWELRSEWLVAQFSEGREAIMTAVRELRAAGFYRVERRRRDDGTFTTGISVSDVALPEWTAQHRAARASQRTDKPKWDVSLRVLADGSVEDEPARPGPVGNPGDYPLDGAGLAAAPAGESAGDRKRVSGDRAEPFTGPQESGHRSARRQETDTQKDTTGISGGVSHVSRGSLAVAPLEAPIDPAVAERPAPPALELVPPVVVAAPVAVDVPDRYVASGRPDGAPPLSRCPRHLSDLNPPSCRDCRDARLENEAWAERQRMLRARAEAAGRAAERERRALAAAELAACRLCDSSGTMLGVEVADEAVSLVCTHDEAANERAIVSRGDALAELRRVLARPRSDGSARGADSRRPVVRRTPPGERR